MASKYKDSADDYEQPIEEKTYVKNRVKLLQPIRIIATEKTTVTGNRYEWAGAGSIVEVDERDVPVIMNFRTGMQPCASCGRGDSILFLVLD